MESFYVFITSRSPRASENTLLLFTYDSGPPPEVVWATPGPFDNIWRRFVGHTVSGGQGSCWTPCKTQDVPHHKELRSPKGQESLGGETLLCVRRCCRNPSSFGEIHI